MGLERYHAVIDSRLHERVAKAELAILKDIAILTNDNAPAGEMIRIPFGPPQDKDDNKNGKPRPQDLQSLTNLSPSTIKRALKSLDERDIIRKARSAHRYGPTYDLVIIDQDYINALESRFWNRDAKKTAGNGQHAAVSLVTVHDERSRPSVHGERSCNGTVHGEHSHNRNGHSERSHSKKKGSIKKDLDLKKAPAAGGPTSVTPGRAQPENPAQTNEDTRSELYRLWCIIQDPKSTYEEREQARKEVALLQGRTPAGTRPVPVPQAHKTEAVADSQPKQAGDTVLRERLTELLEARPVRERNLIVRRINGDLASIRASKLPSPQEQAELNAYITHCIASLEGVDAIQTPAGAAVESAMPASAPQARETGAPADEQQDLIRAAKQATLEYRKAQLERSQRRRSRKPARQTVHPRVITPQTTDHRPMRH